MLEDDYRITIDTVGVSMLNKNASLLNCLKKVNKLGLPVDGITTETIGWFRHGLDFDKCNEILSLANTIEANICINTVVHKRNTSELCLIAEYIQEFKNVKKWQLFQYMPIGPGGHRERPRYEISEDEFNTCVQDVQMLTIADKISVEYKSLSARKNKYIILGADGVLWYPDQTPDKRWTQADSNNSRFIVGSIWDEDIFSKMERCGKQ